MTFGGFIRELLETEARRINSPAFIDSDPVQFPRKFSDPRDIEVSSLLSAIMAWGNRKMICRDVERAHSLMEWQPYAYMASGGYEDLPDGLNLHRTLFGVHFKWLMRGLAKVYDRYGSLDGFAHAVKAGETEAPSWELVGALNRIMEDANGHLCSRCLPANMKTTALKRINMALRWLVRDDGIVDMGIWKSIPKSKLFIPLDVHVGNTARELGLLLRRQNDRRAVEELTERLRELNPADPALYDFALFGIGMEGKLRETNAGEMDIPRIDNSGTGS